MIMDAEALSQRIREIEAESECQLCIAVQCFETGWSFRYNADTACKTASIIKLPILIHAAFGVDEGTLDWKTALVLTDSEKVGGAGVLRSMTAGMEISLRDACVLMTIISDNTATNMVIDYLGVEPVNARMRELGYLETTLFRKAYREDTEESRPFGFGKTTPEEMLRVLVALTEGRIGNQEVSTDVIAIMERQIFREGIPRYLPSDWKYAGKTGSVDNVRNDVGIVTAPDGKRFLLSLFCQNIKQVLWTPENPGTLALAKLAALFTGNN